MKIRLSLVLFVLLLFAVVWGVAVVGGYAATGNERNDEIARAVIARERASAEAWQRKDKAFFQDYLADDATFFDAMNPYLETDPKANFLPKFEKYVEMYKIEDFEMFNPRVQVYGDTAVLTYNEMISGAYDGRPSTYTGKVTMVYVRQGGTWRGVHYHESVNK